VQIVYQLPQGLFNSSFLVLIKVKFIKEQDNDYYEQETVDKNRMRTHDFVEAPKGNDYNSSAIICLLSDISSGFCGGSVHPGHIRKREYG
jgi:hypothetical protein